MDREKKGSKNIAEQCYGQNLSKQNAIPQTTKHTFSPVDIQYS